MKKKLQLLTSILFFCFPVLAQIDAPVMLPTTNITKTSLTVNWNAVPGATGYLVDIASNGNWNTSVYLPGFQSLGLGNVTSVNVTGLAESAVYQLRIKATDGALASDYTYKTLYSAASIPAPIASQTTYKSFTAEWPSLPEKYGYVINNVKNIAYNLYELVLSEDASFSNLMKFHVSASGNGLISLEAQGLKSSTTYYWKVRLVGFSSFTLSSEFDANFSQVTTTTTSANLAPDNTVLWGPMLSGTIFSIHGDGTAFNYIYGEPSFVGSLNLIQASDGYIYYCDLYVGDSADGGNYSGAVMKVKPDGTGVTVVKILDGPTVGYTNGYLMEASDGNLYGAATGIGTPGFSGANIFRLSKTGDIQNIFHVPDNYNLLYNITEGDDGYFYACASGGSGKGFIFRVDKDGNNYSKLYDFPDWVPGVNRASTGTLVKDSNGDLYGKFTFNDINKAQIVKITNGVVSVVAMLPTSGDYDHSQLMIGTDQFLYGTINSENTAALFKIAKDGTGYTLLHTFTFLEGEQPLSPLVEQNGKIYGTCWGGGSNDYGTLYSINTNGAGFKLMYDFKDDRGDARAMIKVDPNAISSNHRSHIIGTTPYGGTNGKGTIYDYNLDNNSFQVSHHFEGDIYNPENMSLVKYNGKYYGVATGGGAYNKGLIYEWSSNSGYVVRHSFNGIDGGQPEAFILVNGIFYGTTATSESGSLMGVLYKWNPEDPNNGYEVLHRFSGSDGNYPSYSLVHQNGSLYGGTMTGGINNAGVIYEYDIVGGNGFQKRVDLDGTLSKGIFAPMTFVNGKFYGLTLHEGSSNPGASNVGGSIFEWTLGDVQVVHKIFLNSLNGNLPEGELVYNPNTNSFFSTLYSSGAGQEWGLIFEWNPVLNTLQRRFGFNGVTTSGVPGGTLTLHNGNFYGTGNGSDYDAGALYKWDPISSDFTILKKFESLNGNFPDGSSPSYGKLLIETNNNIPVFSNLQYDQEVSTDGVSPGICQFTLTDSDGDDLTVTASSSNQDLIANSNLTVSILPDLNYKVEYQNTSGQPGSTVITITANDGFGGEVSINLIVNVIYSMKLFTASVSGSKNTEVLVPVKVANFLDIVSAQSTFSWDPAVATYVGVEDYRLPGMSTASFGTTNTANGKLAFSWLDPLSQANPAKVDGDTLFLIRFNLSGNFGASTPVEITGDPLPIEVIRDLGGTYEEITVTTLAGTITIDATINVTGDILYANNEPLKSITVTLDGGPADQAYLTGTTGEYEFITSGGPTYTVIPSKTNDPDPLNGIDAADIAAGRRHILGVELLQNPYQLIALDGSQDSKISTLDLVWHQSVILGVKTNYPNNKQWIFIPSDHQFSDNANPFVYPQAVTVSENDEADFIGIKLGDVNLSRNNNQSGRIKSRDVVFEINTPAHSEEEEMEVTIRAYGFKDISAYQLTLNWDSEALEYRGVENEEVETSFGEHQIESGALTALWDESKGKSLTLLDGASLFKLIFIKKAPNAIGEITINGTKTVAKIFDSNLKELNLVARQNSREGKSSGVEFYPNPFDESATINFTLYEPQEVRLEIIDVMGNKVNELRKYFDKGNQTIRVDGEMLAPGSYLFSLSQNSNKVIKKMIVKHN